METTAKIKEIDKINSELLLIYETHRILCIVRILAKNIKARLEKILIKSNSDITLIFNTQNILLKYL